MGFCVNCRYHTTEKTGKRTRIRCIDLGRYTAEVESMYLKSKGHYCTNPSFIENDFVTGEVVYADCYKKNSFDECVFYDDGTNEIDDNPTEENGDNPSENTPTDNPIDDNSSEGDPTEQDGE